MSKPLKKFRVSIPFFCSYFVTVEAEDEKKAVAKAVENAHPSICYHCSNQIEIGEMDDSCEITSEIEND